MEKKDKQVMIETLELMEEIVMELTFKVASQSWGSKRLEKISELINKIEGKK